MNGNETENVPPRSAGRIRTRLLALLVSVAVVGVVGMAAAGTATAAPPTARGPVALGPVVEEVAGTVNGVAATGTLTITRFVASGGALQAVGTLTGALAGGGTVPVTAPVDLAATTGTCSILNLVLGPLHLNLLGLVIDLNQVVLNITAVQGPGNLLGNLLCAIAGLLDGPAAPAGGLAGLLNRLLGALFG
jgi:hypothetical protein